MSVIQGLLECSIIPVAQTKAFTSVGDISKLALQPGRPPAVEGVSTKRQAILPYYLPQSISPISMSVLKLQKTSPTLPISSDGLLHDSVQLHLLRQTKPSSLKRAVFS